MTTTKKRSNDFLYPSEDIDAIMSVRKIRKCTKNEVIGFCDTCEKLTAVTPDKEFPQFLYCIDCEIVDIAFQTDFLKISSPTHIIEVIKENNDITSPKAKQTCSGCCTNEPNQLAHMDFGGCLYTDESEEIN